LRPGETEPVVALSREPRGRCDKEGFETSAPGWDDLLQLRLHRKMSGVEKAAVPADMPGSVL